MSTGSAFANMSISAQDHAIQLEVADFPALAPDSVADENSPEGVTVNFDHPYSRASLLVTTSAVLISIVTLFVALRTYTKMLVNKSGLGKEDYACLLSWAGFIVFNSFGLWMVPVGFGVHQWDVRSIDAIHLAQRANYNAITYEPTIFFAKLALLLAILKIFAPNRGLNPAVYWICHATIWFNLILYTIILFLRIFQCVPVAKIWDPFLPGTCRSPITTLVIASSLNAVTDFVILIVPLISISKLQMSKRQKWGVSAIFATGIFACICSILRTVNGVRLFGVQDLTFHLMDNALWADGELSSAIIASCMISIPQFVRHISPKLTNITNLISHRWKKTTDLSGSAESVVRAHKPNPVQSYPSDTSTLKGDYIELEEGNQNLHSYKPLAITPTTTEIYDPR